ncbi:MAG TPA: hypothetical protein PLS49_04930 [Candidatus Woesebacteria bacterium]|nr:hypothetical protein [Candidatus Woesebacteria bacterium]
MKFNKKYLKQISTFVRNNYLVVLFGCMLFIVGSILLLRFLTQEEKTIYVKVKVSQGLWWASTLKPSIWLAESLQVGDKEVNLSGKPIAEILEVRKYPLAIPNYISEQYDVFLIVKMQANYNENTQKYNFKRSDITVGGPIEYEFQKTTITGTVIEMSDKPLIEEYIEKIVTLKKELAQEWEYDSIVVGDSYFDGKDVMLEIRDKNITNTFNAVSQQGTNYPTFSTRRVDIVTTVNMKLKKNTNIYVLREELPITLGRRINLALEDSILTDFIVTDIQ